MNLKLFKSRDFRLLVMGKLVSMLGTNMQNFAFSLYVLKLTGSGTQFASILALGMLPQLLLGPIGGVFADWLDRKKMIVTLDMISGTVISIMAFIYYINGGLEMIHIYITVITLSVVSVLFSPAAGAILPMIVNKEDLMEANATNSLVLSIAQIAGPILAGTLYGFLGLFPILIINALSFMLSAISEAFINIPKLIVEKKDINLSKFKTDFLEGINFIKTRRKLIKVTVVAFMTNFAISPMFSVGLMYLAQVVLKVTEFQLGALNSISATGMIIGPILAGTIVKKFETEDILAVGIMICGFMTGIIAIIVSPFFLNTFNSNLVPYISLMAVIFMVIGVVVIVSISLQTMFQREVPREMLGRAGSVLSTISMASIPLGQIIFGRLFDITIPILPPIIVCALLVTTGIICKNPMASFRRKKVFVPIEDKR